MNRDQALEKIKKCLRLSKSSNEHEAATALRQAQALMREHGLTATDVRLADVTERPVRARSVVVNRWDALLARTVADAFGCDWFSLIRNRLGTSLSLHKVRDVVFVGIGSAPEIAGYAYEVLLRQCQHARGAHVARQPKQCSPMTKTARGDEFALGWVLAASELVEAFAGIDAERLLIEQYMQIKHPNLASSKPRNTAVGRNVRRDDFGAGMHAGKSARLDRGIGAAEGPNLLGGA